MKYTLIVEKTGTGYCSYVPDLPGCIGAAATLPKLRTVMAKAIQMHIEGMRENGEDVPPPTSLADSVEVEEYVSQ